MVARPNPTTIHRRNGEISLEEDRIMWQTWLSGLIGIWLIISPWIYKFDGNNGALWNNIVFGAIILILAIWSGTTTKNQKP